MDRRRFICLPGLAALSPSGVLRSSWHAASQTPSWQPDGVPAIARLGVLTPDFDPVPETELAAMAPRGVSLHASRVPRNKTAAAFAEPPHVDEAADRLIELAPRAVLFAYTSSSYALGAGADGPTRARLETRLRGIPVVMTSPAAVDALRALQVTRVALVHPPWFSDEVNARGQEYFRGHGFEVVVCERLSPARSFTEVPPAEVYEWVRAKTPPQAEAVFGGGNGLRAIGAIHALEEMLRRPVITANQVLFWAALRAAEIRTDFVVNYGRLFRML
jgi:maleate isomerase